MEKEMETDEEMKEVTDKPFVWEEIDLDYEFDVAMYYDFTRPETEKEIKEAEDWFKFAGTYPPSPFVLKLNEEEVRAECNSMEHKNVQNHWDDHKNYEIDENDSGKSTKVFNFYETNSKLFGQAKSTTGNTFQHGSSKFSLGDSIEISSQRSSLNVSHAIKRQKLEAGYFSNVPRSKRQTSLLHKVPKKIVSEVFPPLTKIKATIPKEPNLKTANRAQRDRSKIDMTTTEHNKLDASNFKARPLNRKILEAPTLLPPKKSIPQMPEFQVFYLKTSERAAQHTYVVNSAYVSNSLSENKCTRRPSPLHNMKQERGVKVKKCKARPRDKILSNNKECDVFVNCKDGTSVSKEFNCLDQKRCSDELPTKLLSKLTLSSDCNQCSTKCHCKMHFPGNCSKENVTSFLNQEHEVIDILLPNSRWLVAK